MCPGLSLDHVVNALVADIECSAKFGLSDSSGAVDATDFEHVLFGEPGMRVVDPFAHQTAFGGLGDIFSVSPKVEASRVNADWPITVMKNVKTLRDGAVVNAVRGSDCCNYMVFCPKMSISFVIRSSCPVPASVFGGFTGHEPSECFSLGQSRRCTKCTGVHRVTSVVPALIVHTAPASGKDRLEAIWDGARRISHIDTHLSVVPRPVSAGAGRSTPIVVVRGGVNLVLT